MVRIIFPILVTFFSLCGMIWIHADQDTDILEKPRSSEINIRKSAVTSLKQDSDSSVLVPLISILQQETDKQLRESLACQLVTMSEHNRDKRAVEPLVKILQNDKDGWVRVCAAEALGNLRMPQALAPLVAALKNDSNYQVRGTAAQSLGRIAVPEAIDPLLNALKDKASSVRGSSALALFWMAGTIPEYMKNEKTIQSLVNAFDLTDPLGQINHEICLIFGRLKVPQSIEPLLNLLQKDIDPHLKVSIEDILISMKGENNPALNEFLAKRNQAQQNINYADEGGVTRLHRAVADNKVEEVMILLSQGADVNARLDGGSSALMMAVADGNYELVKTLVSKGADISLKDVMGRTVFYYAIEKNDKKMVELLLAYKADINAKNIQGVTPYGYAKFCGFDDMAVFLKEKGAHPGVLLSEENYAPWEPKNEAEAQEMGLAFYAFIYRNAGYFFGNDLNEGDYAVYSPYGNDESVGDAGKVEVKVTKRQGDVVEVIQKSNGEETCFTFDVKRKQLLKISNSTTKKAFDSSSIAQKDIARLSTKFIDLLREASLYYFSTYKLKKSAKISEIKVPAGSFKCILIEPDFPATMIHGMSAGNVNAWKETKALYLNSKVPKLFPLVILGEVAAADSFSILGEFNEGLVKLGDFELIDFVKTPSR